MKTNLSALFLLFILSVLIAPNIYAVTFSDSFESGDLTASDSNGFKWMPKNERTGVVKRSDSKNGDYSLRFIYPAGVFISERRFDMGKAYPEIWIKYWLRVPVNFIHEKSINSNWASNNKLFALWMDQYTSKGDGPTVVWEFWKNGEGGSNLAVHYNKGGYGGTNKQVQFTPFIKYPDDQGRWMKIIMHIKAATSRLSNDGVIQMWRRWDDEGNFTKFHELNDANIASPPNGPLGWQKGYLMGWSNSGFKEDTEWLIDDFTVSNEKPTELDGIALKPKAPVMKTPKLIN